MKFTTTSFAAMRITLLSKLIACFMTGYSASADSDYDKRSIALDDLLGVRDSKTMAVSPDGNHVAYQVFQADKARNDYDITWYVVATASNAKPIKIANGGDAIPPIHYTGRRIGELRPDEVLWSQDSRWFAYTLRKDGEVQIWRSHRDRAGQEQLTHNDADVEDLKLSKDGSKLFFAVGRNRAAVRKANEREGRQGYLAQEPAIYDLAHGPIWPSCANGKNKWRVEVSDRRSCSLTIWVFEIQTGTERKASASEAEAYFAKDDLSQNTSLPNGILKGDSKTLVVASHDGKRFAWFENEDPGVFKGPIPPMWVAASLGGKSVRCPVDACKSTRPQKIWWSADGKEIIFLVLDGPRNTLSSLYGWVPGESVVRTILRTDDTFHDCTKIGDRLICGHESWTSPRKIVSVGLLMGDISTVVDMNLEFEHFSFTKVEKILGEDAYGNLAHAHLVYPKGYREGQRYPLVVVQYRSRGFLRGGMGDEHPIHVLAQSGLAVLSFDKPNDEKNRSKTDNSLDLRINAFRYEMVDRGPVTAIERMVCTLSERGLVDPSLVGISGVSAGAMAVDTALLSRNYAAASAALSMTAPPNFTISSLSGLGKVMNGTYGGTPFSEAGFESRAKHSVGVNAHRIDTPYLLQVADREYQYTIQNYNALKEARKPVEMYIYPDEYHIKWQPAHRYAVYTRNLDWFNFWLRDVEDEDPAKAEQYKRWRKLRSRHHANILESSASKEKEVNKNLADLCVHYKPDVRD